MTAALSAAQAATSSTTARPVGNSRQALSIRVNRLSGEEIARELCCDLSTASRIASDQRGATMSQWLKLLDLCGLKLVSKDKLCVSRDEFEFMRRTTARAIANEQIAATLFEDPE